MLKSVFLFVVLQCFFLQMVKSAALPAADNPVPEDCAEAAKDLLSSSGSSLYGAVRDTTTAAFGATKFCVVECVKIFDKALKSAMAFNIADVGHQAVKFVECFFRCVKVVLGALGVSIKSASNFVDTSTNGATKLAGVGANRASKLVSAGKASSSSLAGGFFNSVNPFMPLKF